MFLEPWAATAQNNGGSGENRLLPNSPTESPPPMDANNYWLQGSGGGALLLGKPWLAPNYETWVKAISRTQEDLSTTVQSSAIS
jgi:hypothetical protein